MDHSTIVAQLSSFTASLVQIISLLESISSVAADKEDPESGNNKQRLHDSKFEIIEAVITLNSFIFSHLRSIETTIFAFAGSLVLAPRFYEGRMCLDFAIVTLIKSCSIDSQSFVSQDKHDVEVSESESDAFVKNSNQTLKILWLRPHSRYELFSHTISFSESQLDFENVFRILQDQELQLKSLSVGDKVLYISLLNDTRYGTWRKGKVQKIVDGGDYVQIEHEIKNSASNASISSVMLPLKITFVSPLPRKENKANTYSHQTEDKKSAKVDSKVLSLYDDMDECEDDQDGITALPSLYGAMLAKDSNTVTSATTGSSYPLGLWFENSVLILIFFSTSSFIFWTTMEIYRERHTKGFGGKILAKMGFRRGQGGLGKQGQGILQPIDVGLVPLPSGLGLDFIHEAKKDKTDNLTEEEANEKRRIKIVQDFNKRTSKATKVSAVAIIRILSARIILCCITL